MHKYHHVTKKYICEVMERRRSEWSLTQEKMAELLQIGERAYSDLANGKSCCSATTLMFFLGQLQATEIRLIVEAFLNLVIQEDMRKEAE